MSAARHIARALLIAGILAVGYVAYVVIDAHAYQKIEHRQFQDVSTHASPARAAVDGTAIGEIHVPRLGLTAVIPMQLSPSTRWPTASTKALSIPPE